LPEILADHPDVAAPGPFTDSWQRRHFYEALATAILKARAPLVLAIDDLQWCDGETLEWLAWLIRFEPAAHLLVVATIRIQQVDKQQPVLAILRDLTRTGQFTELPLGPLSPDETALLAARTALREFQPDASSALHDRTRGNPLFIIETVRSGWTGCGEEIAMPARVHAVIASRLAQLSDGAHQVAGAAAAIGRPFTPGLLAVVAASSEDAVATALDELWERRILQPDARGVWDFTHGNLREVAYDEVGPARHQLLHRQAAEALEKLYAASPDAASLQIAGHFERAAQVERAMPWYERAALVARRAYAEEEAIALLNRALSLLEQLPQTPARDRAELGLLSVLGPACSATRGYASPEVGRVSARARLLCELTADAERTFPVLASSWGYHVVRGEFGAAREIALRYQQHAQREQDPVRMAAGKFIEASPAFHRGALLQSMDTFLSVGDRRRSPGFAPFFEMGPELTVFSAGYLCHLWWLTGDPSRARIEAEQNIQFATAISHPFSLAFALAYSAMLHQFLDEPDAAEFLADEAGALCRKHNFRYYLSWTPMIRGWARARKGLSSGLEEMREGFAAMRATGAQVRAPYYLSLLAEVLREADRPGEAAQLLREAFLIGEQQGELWIKPELERIQADLLRDAGAPGEADVRCREAIRLAREQGSKAFEFRAEKALQS
jgi:predicted ATPase